MNRRVTLTAIAILLLASAPGCGGGQEEPEDATDVQAEPVHDEGNDPGAEPPMTPDSPPMDQTEPSTDEPTTPGPESRRAPGSLPAGSSALVPPAAPRSAEVCEGIQPEDRDRCPFDPGTVTHVEEIESGVVLRMADHVEAVPLEGRIRCYQTRARLRPNEDSTCPLGDPEVVANVDEHSGRIEVKLVAGGSAHVPVLRQRAAACAQHSRPQAHLD